MEMHKDHSSKIKNWLQKSLIVGLLIFVVGIPNFTIAAGYELLAPIPIGGNINDPNPSASVPDVTKYIENGFLLAIALAGLFAVVRIVWAGITIMSTDAVSGRSAGKEIIRDAIYGFILAIGAYAILYTVNPRLLIFNLDPGSIGFTSPTFQTPPKGTSSPEAVGISRRGGGGTGVIVTPPPVSSGSGGVPTPTVPPPLTSTLNICKDKKIIPNGTQFKYGSLLGETLPSLVSVYGSVDSTKIATIVNPAYILTDDGLWWNVRFTGEAFDVYILEKTPSDPTSNYLCAPETIPDTPTVPKPTGGTINVGDLVQVINSGVPVQGTAGIIGGPTQNIGAQGIVIDGIGKGGNANPTYVGYPYFTNYWYINWIDGDMAGASGWSPVGSGCDLTPIGCERLIKI